jgi:hypothetical protein
MADAVHLGQATNGVSAGHRAHRHAHTHTHSPATFQQALQRALDGESATGRFQSNVHNAVARVPAVTAAKPAKAAPVVPVASADALTKAMALEHVPASQQSSLTFIMAHESSGKVDVRSPVHSARGLFQLTAANYHYNPQGAASFGNAVQEAQGGIRYIQARYGTADKAVAFWQQHHWY